MNQETRFKLYCQSTRDEKVRSSMGGTRLDRYSAEFKRMFPNTIHRVCFVGGDNIRVMETPTIVKSRRIGDRNAVLLPLHWRRHWTTTPKYVQSCDIPWEKKRLDVVWRGSTTGIGSDENALPRVCLVRRWFDADETMGINVAFSSCVQGRQHLSHLIGERMSMTEQLKYAFIISVEGNDVATNLKWLLASNSTPIMPKPRYETWLLESQLKPMVHYVPVKPDFSDLDKVLAWCRSNVDKCRKIAVAGQRYIAQFFADQAAERLLARRVLNRYLNIKPKPKRRLRCNRV